MRGLSVIGLGKLGACTAACFAYKGFNVIGTDVNGSVVDAINNHTATACEPRLQELISASGSRLSATMDYNEIVSRSDISFFIVPTPSKPNGHFSEQYLKTALRRLAEALKKARKEYHLIVITSTVSPGTTQESLIPFIEAVSGGKLNIDFGVCYNPEFIALGSVINNFLNPDLVLIGESDRFAGDMLEPVYKQTCESKPHVARMSIVSAEITKISLNSYITMKITFANTLASICEAIPQANVDDITKALGADKRISPYYLRGGLAYGGPCFPRDNRAFAAFAKKFGHNAKLAKATDQVNTDQIERLKDVVLEQSPPDSKVSVLGLAYKPDTPVIEESASIKLVEELLNHSMVVSVYDPLAMNAARRLFGDSVKYASSMEECLADSACWVFALPYEQFKGVDRAFVTHNNTTVVDCWRIIEPARLGSDVRYIGLGRAHECQVLQP
jgi:UDPglucose 6-dehydrogenase